MSIAPMMSISTSGVAVAVTLHGVDGIERRYRGRHLSELGAEVVTPHPDTVRFINHDAG